MPSHEHSCYCARLRRHRLHPVDATQNWCIVRAFVLCRFSTRWEWVPKPNTRLHTKVRVSSQCHERWNLQPVFACATASVSCVSDFRLERRLPLLCFEIGDQQSLDIDDGVQIPISVLWIVADAFHAQAVDTKCAWLATFIRLVDRPVRQLPQ